MKIFDCFMFYDEEMILDFRLNYLNQYVDRFVIVESSYTHSGKKRKLLFDINKYNKFKDKISYIILDEEPKNLFQIKKKDNSDRKNSKYILNAAKRENLQRNFITKGLKDASSDDMIIISDVDEIPNLEKKNLKDIKKKIILFNQNFFYYKFNLKLENFNWYGSRACKKSDLKSPQWLRNIKSKQYPKWRIDLLFSKTKHNDIFFIENGGWHFSNMKTPHDIDKKMSTYLHHREYDLNSLGPEKIAERIKDKKTIYNLKTDMKTDKFNNTENLIATDLKDLPVYLQENLSKYKHWIAEF